MARPREFDEDAVLIAAGEAFWAKGYEATSTRDLVKCTGLSQPSLYNAFGDKRMLFQRALEHYIDRMLRERIDRLESTRPPGAAIAGFFAESIDRSLRDPRQRGCFLVNTSLESVPQDPEFRCIVADRIGEMRRFFLRCLTAGQADGSIPKAVTPEEGAAHLLAVALGLRVIARIDPSPAILAGTVSPALRHLGLPALPDIATDTPASSARGS